MADTGGVTRPALSIDRVRRVGRTLTGAGAALVALGILGTVAGVAGSAWPLLVLGLLAVAVGVVVMLAGLGVRRAVAQSDRLRAGAQLDAQAAEAVAAAVSDRAPAGCAADRAGCDHECTAACVLAGLRPQ